MLAGFTEEQIDDMDPARRQRLLWGLFGERLVTWMQIPFLEKKSRAAIDLTMLPPDPRPPRA